MKSISTFTVVHSSSFTTTLGHHSWQVCFNQEPEGNYFVVRQENLIPQSQGHHRSGKLTFLLQCLHADIWKHWNTHVGSALPHILCLTVSMSRPKTLRHASSFPHTFLGLILLTSYFCKSLKESSTWRFGCRIHGLWYQSWLLPRQDTLHVPSSYLQQHDLICSLAPALALSWTLQ